MQRALGTSAQLHKRALHLQRACSAKDALIAHQQAALESKDHATSNMQSTIARLTQSATEQERIIAEQQAAIAALQVHITKLVCHDDSNKHSNKYKTHQQSSQVGILTTEQHPSQCLTLPVSCRYVLTSAFTLAHLGIHNLALVRHEHDQPIACNQQQQRHTLPANALVKCCSLLAQCSHCTHEDTKFVIFVPDCMCLCKLHGQPACMLVQRYWQCLGSP